MKKRVSIWLSVCAALLGSGAWAFYGYGRGSWDFLQCRLVFEYFLHEDSKEVKEEVASGLSNTYYFTSYYLNAMLSAAEGTHSSRLLRMSMRYIDTMIDSAGEHRERGETFRVWKPFTLGRNSTHPRPNLQYSLQATIPIARAAAIIMSDPRWRAKYSADAVRYTDFVDQYVFQYWYRLQMKEELPWLNRDVFPVWHGAASSMALNAAFLYQATGAGKYRAIASRIGESFRSKLRPFASGWIWENQTIPKRSGSEAPGSVGNQAGVPDTSQSNREAFMMVALHEAGILFTRQDLERMAATVSDTLWNGSESSPVFSNYINGSNQAYDIYKQAGSNGSIYHGWALTGAYSPKVQEILLDTMRAALYRRLNPSMERNIVSYGGRISLCGHALRNFALERNGEKP